VIASEFAGQLVRDDSWPTLDCRGQRVAVIASGEDAARIVPVVARSALKVTVFLHTPAWVLPRPEGPAGALLHLGTRLPVVGPRARRLLATRHLRHSVRDSWTRRRLTPDGRFTRPRATTSPLFYRALEQENCRLITWPVFALAPHGVRTAEGIEHPADIIIVGSDVDIATAQRQEDIA
jgi:cation diffusion facilitator CzcD-associated flavoprotein CzcO